MVYFESVQQSRTEVWVCLIAQVQFARLGQLDHRSATRSAESPCPLVQLALGSMTRRGLLAVVGWSVEAAAVVGPIVAALPVQVAGVALGPGVFAELLATCRVGLPGLRVRLEQRLRCQPET